MVGVTDFMKYGWNLYAADPKDKDNLYVSPLRATATELKGLPQILVITAESDPLRDEGEAYGRKLKDAGVAVTLFRAARLAIGLLAVHVSYYRSLCKHLESGCHCHLEDQRSARRS